jgi:ornithine cyclodeaminase
LEELCGRAELIVTTTPATEPILTSDLIAAGQRIVAVGADSPGKQELDPRILERARVVVDSCAQCIDHGEAGWAVRAGLLEPGSLIELGALLTAPIDFAAEEIVVADLTGVAVQDVAIAGSVWSRLAGSPLGVAGP